MPKTTAQTPRTTGTHQFAVRLTCSDTAAPPLVTASTIPIRSWTGPGPRRARLHVAWIAPSILFRTCSGRRRACAGRVQALGPNLGGPKSAPGPANGECGGGEPGRAGAGRVPAVLSRPDRRCDPGASTGAAPARRSVAAPGRAVRLRRERPQRRRPARRAAAQRPLPPAGRGRARRRADRPRSAAELAADAAGRPHGGGPPAGARGAGRGDVPLLRRGAQHAGGRSGAHAPGADRRGRAGRGGLRPAAARPRPGRPRRPLPRPARGRQPDRQPAAGGRRPRPGDRAVRAVSPRPEPLAADLVGPRRGSRVPALSPARATAWPPPDRGVSAGAGLELRLESVRLAGAGGGRRDLALTEQRPLRRREEAELRLVQRAGVVLDQAADIVILVPDPVGVAEPLVLHVRDQRTLPEAARIDRKSVV